MKSISLFWALTVHTMVHCQIQETFADGDFTKDPAWTGDTSDFTVLTQGLYLNAPATTDTQVLVTENRASIEASWEMELSMDFNPSSSNYCLVFLTSDKEDLKGELNGYFVKLGGSEDDISLYCQIGSYQKKLIDGRNGVLDKSSNAVKLRVTRSKEHRWELETDTGSSVYVKEGWALDSTHLSTSFFGIFCRHTSTRKDKFSFDNIEVKGQPYVDRKAPILVDSKIADPFHWKLVFDEDIIELTFRDQILMQPQLAHCRARLDTLKANTLIIACDEKFPHGEWLNLKLDSIRDPAGNAAGIESTALFNDVGKIQNGDIIFNEIMFDPSPVQGLPDCEYLEVLNRSSNVLTLSSWSLADAKDTLVLSDLILEPWDMAILCKRKDSSLFSSSVKIACTDHFISLSNEGEALTLFSPDDRIIDLVNYSPEWIDDAVKREGGWSLELIDPNYRCQDASNWSVSSVPAGGSPGLPNSVLDTSIVDIEFGNVGLVLANDSNLVLNLGLGLKWPEKALEWITASPELEFQAAKYGGGLLELEIVGHVLPSQVYSLKLHHFSDCYLRTLKDIEFQVIFPGRPQKGDIVINEVLFNPYPGGSDFLEVYNRSDQYFDLSQLILGNSDVGEAMSPECGFDLLAPGQYAAFCQDTAAVRSDYTFCGRLIQTDLPGYADESGHPYVLNRDSQLMDDMVYSEEMHFALIDDDEGVSLEKLNPDLDGQLSSSWHSASETLSFASPGLVNSQYIGEGRQEDGFTISPDIFSPDNDGYMDVCQISFQTDQPGSVASLTILDQHGSRVKSLAKEVLLATDNHFIWDGSEDEGGKAKAGYYIILLEVYRPGSRVMRKVRSVVLAHYL